VIYLIHKVKSQSAVQIDGEGDNQQGKKYLACFFSGVLFANTVPHFVHGISGEYFPAPFGKHLGNGLLEHLSNVVWGFVNLVLGYALFQRGGVATPSKWGKFFFFAGIFAISIFLCFVFSHFNQAGK
jgi:hypothetical protein